MLALIASDGTDNRVLVPPSLVLGTLSVPLGLSSLVLGLALSVLLLSRVLPAGSTGGVADSLDDVSLGGVELLEKE